MTDNAPSNDIAEVKALLTEIAYYLANIAHWQEQSKASQWRAEQALVRFKALTPTK
jgi:hypothetical protein